MATRQKGARTKTRLALMETSGAKVARQHIQRYTGQDILGQLAQGGLKVEDVAHLADTRAWISEQKEVLHYAAQHLEQIFEDVAQIEFHLKEIITKGLKSKDQINKYLKDVLLAGKKHEHSVHLMTAQYQNELGYLESQQYGELSLEARKSKNKLLLLQADLTAREDEIDTSNDTAMQERDFRKTEAEERAKRRLLLSKGFGAVDRTRQRGQGFGILRVFGIG
ncbi:hypothetical protein [Nostoc sp. ChiQUE01b]|uniref:hypothetical protein n=1 Tax=Nostoc sp. ChiQUE01b TaxID=3075376 RepID=UPI002AD3AB79|nr:hypothetical protein [Nostoc sp. ChiQUE01b]MDZ8260625.1 hypothetical protein [Nostoc sp. ChiQUE01b]